MTLDDWMANDFDLENEIPKRWPDFYAFLDEFDKDWRLSYTGEIYGMWRAFQAGKEVKCL